MAADERVLAFAVSATACAVIVMVGDELVYWVQLRDTPGRTAKIRSRLRLLIAQFEPMVIVHEDPGRFCRKRGESLALLQVLAQSATDEPIRSVRVVRNHAYADSYQEAVALAQRFPEFAPWLPESWSPAYRPSRSMAYFEALSYVWAYREHEHDQAADA